MLTIGKLFSKLLKAATQNFYTGCSRRFIPQFKPQFKARITQRLNPRPNWLPSELSARPTKHSLDHHYLFFNNMYRITIKGANDGLDVGKPVRNRLLIQIRILS